MRTKLLFVMMFFCCVANPATLYSQFSIKTDTLVFSTLNNQGIIHYWDDGAGSFADARKATYGTAHNTSDLNVGIFTSNNRLFRTFLRYFIPSGIDSIISAKIDAYGANDYSDTDFNIEAYAAYDSGYTYNQLTGGFHRFYVWAASGSYGNSNYSDSWNSSTYQAGYGNLITFNQPGKDSVKAHSGDTLYVALLSGHDISNSLPNNNSAVFFGDDAQSPRLIIEYVTYEPVYAADSLAFSSVTDSSAVLDSIAGNALDVSTSNVFAIYDTSMGVYLDTTQTNPYKTNKITYVKSAWKNKRFPFVRNYTTQLNVMSYASNGVDSLKIKPYKITIGTPALRDTVKGNQGRWDPAIDKIQ